MIETIWSILAGEAPVFLLVAGPNGAGKSTFRIKRLDPLGFPCVDPDAVAIELFGRYPVSDAESFRATEEATRRVRECLHERRSIALESVFSDSKGHKLGLLREAHAAGFRTVLVFIGVDHPQLCMARVADRVDHGGHNVPDEIISDRFPRCFENLKAALNLVDLAVLVDNSGCYGPKGQADPTRHYVFCVIDRSGWVKRANPVPHWFTVFGVAEALRFVKND